MSAGLFGLLDDVAVEDCRAFETELYRFIDNARPSLWEQIRQKKVMDDALKGELTGIINEFKQRFQQERRGQPAAVGARA